MFDWLRRNTVAVKKGLEEARRERAKSEERLVQTESEVIVPLRELRDSDQVELLIKTAIRRKRRKEGD
jgi:hypothetical protein